MNTGNISQMGDCWVLVAGFGKEWILWVMQDFCVCGLHSSTTLTPHNMSFLLSSNSEQFFQAITSPCLLRREPPCPAPRGVPGSWITLLQDPLREISANPCLKRLFLCEPEQVPHIRLHTMQNTLESISSVTLMDLCWDCHPIAYSGFTSVEEVEAFDGHALKT